MLPIEYIRNNSQYISNRLAVRGFTNTNIVDQILGLDDKRKEIQTQLDETKAKSNQISKQIGQLYKEGKQEEAEKAKQETGELKEQVKNLQQQMTDIQQKQQELLVEIPNVPHPAVKEGNTEADNIEIRTSGEIFPLNENALPHWDLAKKYNLIDFELGNKLTGSGFPVFKNRGAKLERALISYFLDMAVDNGYEEYLPPLMVNEDSAFATGQLPDKEGQMYRLADDPFYMIPTAEVPITNMYRDTILKAEDLPVKNVSYTPCFRREAGSYGKHVRGLNRVHQFDKVEIVQIQHPDKSYDTLEEMVQHVEMLLQQLQLPYRIMQLCGGDLGFASAFTYDFEVYAAAQQKWLEVSSVSNFESYQANRLKLRFKDDKQKGTRLAHTLNGSALALARVIAALIENNQTEDGITIPKVLIPYYGNSIIT